MSASAQYSIRDLAAEFGLTTRTLRFYEEKGLLRPRRKGQTRVYSSADRTRLRLILRGKRLGFSLQESSDIISLYDPATGNNKQLQALINKMHEKRSQLEQQQRDLNNMLADLASAEARCKAAMSE
ncbi:MAG: MerR family DNA-binding transcriptional regulator [Gammaproteobacteria bacterium]|nr:MerR family DNA-binding transcriptional regulator [Gammaproteobacteria bacterium]